jgi:hypothetical protein
MMTCNFLENALICFKTTSQRSFFILGTSRLALLSMLLFMFHAFTHLVGQTTPAWENQLALGESTVQSHPSGHAVMKVPLTLKARRSLGISFRQIEISDAENVSIGYFSDLSSTHDGGVAHPTDGSTGNVLQQTLVDAYFWGLANGTPGNPARATVVVASAYPIQGSRILIPGNVALVCSSYSPETLTGGCPIYETDQGNGAATGGSPLIQADFSIGVLPDHKTKCTLFDVPAQPGCTIMNSRGGSVQGVTLIGVGVSAGGADVGIRVAADNFHISDVATAGFFGGPAIQNVGAGVNDAFDWIYYTNVNTWWCANSASFSPETLFAALLIQDGNLGGVDIPMIDGEETHIQGSTGCAFSKNFAVSGTYPHFAAIHVGGSGNLIEANLPQADAIGFLITGQNQTVVNNRSEYQGRETILSTASNSLFLGNHLTSGCLDPNLPNLMVGSADDGIPNYPTVPTLVRLGTIIKDSNGNIEQVIYVNQTNGAGLTDVSPDWPTNAGDIFSGNELVWENMGKWTTGAPQNTEPSGQPVFTSGDCLAVRDLGQGNTWADNSVSQEVGVNGPSYYRGSYYVPFLGAESANICDRDSIDANGNGQCWWGGDLFSNGGPPNLPSNGRTTNASGGSTAWVGDYSYLKLTDSSPQKYNNFQGMSSGQSFWISSTSADEIDSWGLDGGGAVYNHPSLLTCGGVPLIMQPNQWYQFHYDPSGAWGVTQLGCPETQAAPPTGPLWVFSNKSIGFPSQVDGTASPSQAVTLTNNGSKADTPSISISGDFAMTNTCAGSVVRGASCTILLTFSPTSSGERTGTLTAANGNQSATVALSGIGETPLLTGPSAAFSVASLAFAAQVEGTTSSAQTVSLTNQSANDLTPEIYVSGDYAETNTCGGSLGPGAACTLSIIFSPTAAGSRSGTLTASGGAAGALLSVSLTGTGEAQSGPFWVFSAINLSFPPQIDGSASTAQTVALTNLSTGPINPSISITGEFSQSNTCTTALEAGASCTVTVTSQPSSPGVTVGRLNAWNSDGNMSLGIALSGGGESFVMSAVSDKLTIEGPGGTASAPISVSSQGGYGGAVVLQCIVTSPVSVATLPLCSLTPASLNIKAETTGISVLTISSIAAEAPSNTNDHSGLLGSLMLGGVFLARDLRKKKRFAGWAVASCLVILFTIGCGVTGTPSSVATHATGPTILPSPASGTSPGNYQVVITATSGSLTQSITIPLAVD